MLVIVSYITILSIMHPRVTALPFVKYHQLHPPLLPFRKQCPFTLDKKSAAKARLCCLAANKLKENQAA